MKQYLLKRAGLLLIGLFVVVMVALGATSWRQFDQLRDSREWVRHSYEVLLTIRQLDGAIGAAETGQRGFLLTGEDAYLGPYHEALDTISLLQGRLQSLTADNPAQQARIAVLAPAMQRKLEELAQTVQLRRSSGPDEAVAVVRSGRGRALREDITTALLAMTAQEQTLLAERIATAETSLQATLQGVLAGTTVAVVLLGFGTLLLARAADRHQRMLAQQKTLSDRLRTSLDSLSQGIGVFGPDRRLVDWNACFQDLLQLPAAMVRSGTPYAAIVEQTTEAGTPLLETEPQLQFRRGPRPGTEVIVYERQRAGDRHSLEVRRTPLPDGGFVLTISDMTARAQAEAVLRESQKMQAIGQLTGGIAHDFNNLLTVVLGNLEFLRSRLEAGSPLLTRLDRAEWATRRGATLTAQLLAFARKQPLAPQPLDLSRVLTGLMPLLQRTLDAAIELRFVDAAGLWPAMADESQLENAVLNLALNARDAMPEGGRLTIELANKVLDDEYARAHAEVTPGDYVMLAVSDTGTGMPPAVAARAFEPFFTTKPVGKGTGLGLAMVFGFLKQSGGHAKIYSEPGEGTTIRLYLPRAIGAAPAGLARTEAPAELPRGSATVLLVEDEAPVREITAAMLRDLGYRVLEAADGEQALRVFGASPLAIELLLLDVVLPGRLRGRDVAERILALRPGLPVLYMSGYTENAIVHQGRLDDGVHLIGKPFDRERLARKVAQLLAACPADTVSKT
ncbi:Histidine kinase [Rhodovastum atsumiense]|uniref:histidine kinase n=1 Tax=Rhodovastum atsumiense TaxID=504468 RepID=A0A5M6J276_9PROT|nr:CHASE3 domain-containing protein [Rhodovastum atsumiense]KAA5614187.1 response regulator [Rhodovastum atsumiense]CAH2599046.1 Histidine kinase [Rhodovastum atsumiense]